MPSDGKNCLGILRVDDAHVWVIRGKGVNVHPMDEIFEYFQLETAKPNTIAKYVFYIYENMLARRSSSRKDFLWE
jgi:hypothetical protein